MCVCFFLLWLWKDDLITFNTKLMKIIILILFKLIKEIKTNPLQAPPPLPTKTTTTTTGKNRCKRNLFFFFHQKLKPEFMQNFFCYSPIINCEKKSKPFIYSFIQFIFNPDLHVVSSRFFFFCSSHSYI